MRGSIHALFYLSLVTAACGPAPERRHERPPPAVVDPAERAADGLRDRWIAFDRHGCARDGEALVRAHPESGRLRAWWIGCVSAAGRHGEADALATAMLSERPGDGWAELARVLAWLGEPALIRPELLPYSEALPGALAGHPDAVLVRARALHRKSRWRELEALSASSDGVLLASERAAWLFEAARQAPTRLPEALAVAHGVAAEAPEFVATAEVASGWLPQHQRMAEALAWADAGLARAPAAVPLLRRRWWLLTRQPGVDEAVARAAVLADIEAALARFGEQPAVLLAAAESLRDIGQAGRAEPIEAAILAEFAAAPEAEAVLFRRLEPAAAAPASAAPPDPEAMSLRQTMLAAYLARPHHHDPFRRQRAATWRLEALRADPSADPAAILAAVEELCAVELGPPFGHVAGMQALIERTPHLDRAEALARAGLERVEAFVQVGRRAGYAAMDILERDLSSVLHTRLANLYLKTGRLDDARAALRQAERQALGPFAELQLALAELARRSGDLAAAESHLIAGIEQIGDGGDRCWAALAELYRQRHGGLRGLPEHIEQVAAESRARRKATVLAGKIADPAPAPDFALAGLDGRTVTLSSLRGKRVVLHFWYTTCSGCLQEMPGFVAFAGAHVGDPDVAVLSLHLGNEAGEVAAWMRQQGLEFPVLMENGYAERAGISGWPTTWFLDQEGRLRFTTRGSGLIRNLREEFDWRLEALGEGGPGAQG